MRYLLIILCLLAAAQTRVHGPTQVRDLAGGGAVGWYYGTLGFGPIAANACAELSFSAPGASPGMTVAPGWPYSLPAPVHGIMYAADNAIVVRLCSWQSVNVPPLNYSAAVVTWR